MNDPRHQSDTSRPPDVAFDDFDPIAEERLIAILRREGFFRRGRRRTWITAAAAAVLFFALGVVTGVRLAAPDTAPAAIEIESAQPSADGPSQTQGVIWF